jgi:hypothetical protein
VRGRSHFHAGDALFLPHADSMGQYGQAKMRGMWFRMLEGFLSVNN